MESLRNPLRIREQWIQYSHTQYRFMKTKACLYHNKVKLSTYSCKMSRGERNLASLSIVPFHVYQDICLKQKT